MQNTLKMNKEDRAHTIIKNVLYGSPSLDEVAEELGVSIRSIQRAFSDYGLPMPSTRLPREHVSLIYEAGLYGVTSGDELIGFLRRVEGLEEQLRTKEVALLENLVDLPDNDFTTFMSRLFESRAKKQILKAISKLNQPE